MSLLSLWGEPLAPQYTDMIWSGLQCTLVLSIESIALALVLGLLLCIARMSPLAPVRGIAIGWLALFRNTPLLVQLLFWYFAFPGLLPQSVRLVLMTPAEWTLFGTVWESPSWEFLASLIGLTLYTASYVAEECRSGVATVSKGQWRAAQALGMTSGQAWRSVILPQALRAVVSPLMGQFMNAIKNSSLAMAVGYAELFYVCGMINDATQRTFELFGIVTVLYIATVGVVELLNAILTACMTPLHGRRN
ncbi:amino acid ABC transporter permease [Zymobacter sp. IVIA_5232.4 C2]|uniref:amino acid ABC transporter permease n=1 Tax=Zymobacter sp. IVIA_5232.4 C2 TaxID=3394855 RepID=UPI0039C19112